MVSREMYFGTDVNRDFDALPWHMEERCLPPIVAKMLGEKSGLICMSIARTWGSHVALKKATEPQ